MAWHRPGDKPLSESMLVYLKDAYMRHSASMSWPSHTHENNCFRALLFAMQFTQLPAFYPLQSLCGCTHYLQQGIFSYITDTNWNNTQIKHIWITYLMKYQYFRLNRTYIIYQVHISEYDLCAAACQTSMITIRTSVYNICPHHGDIYYSVVNSLTDI